MIRTLTAAQRPSGSKAMKPVWKKFEGADRRGHHRGRAEIQLYELM